MIQITAIVDNKHCLMLTGETIEEADKSCRHRFGRRFQGFAPIPAEIRARAKWAAYSTKQISRGDLEDWLAEQDDEAEIRAIFNAWRG